jgi:hypothetical protein
METEREMIALLNDYLDFSLFSIRAAEKSYKKLGDWQYINNELRDYVAFFCHGDPLACAVFCLLTHSKI